MIEGSKYTELYRCNSNFGQLQVIELRNTPRRALFNDFLEQGAYDTLSKQSLEMFSYMLHDLATAYTANIHDVLCIGMGVGIVPMQFARENALVDVVEINPAMIPAAKRFFDLDPAKLNIITADGRQYLAKNSKKYDAIILDVFLGDSHPSHMMTRESFAAMRKSLNPGGVLVINSFGNFAPGKDFGVSSINKTICDVFPSVKIHADSSSTGSVNVFFVASASDLSMSRASSFDHVSPLCRSNVMAAFRAPILLTQSNAPIPAFSRAPIPAFPRRGKEFLKSPCGGFRGRDCSGIILTDDYNPVDYYDAANREHYRRCQVRYALSWGNRE
jgi:spermidine synthase